MSATPNDLRVDPAFDPATQRIVAFTIAELEDQTRLLLRAIDGLSVEQLEYQPHPGMNSIGMLLAHIAIAEFYWMNIAPACLPVESEGEALCRAKLGIGYDDDGMPAKPGAPHPATLRGKDADFYRKLLADARAATHAVARIWKDDDLADVVDLGRRSVTKRWILYHIVEHLSGHYGQVCLLKHLHRAAMPGA